MTTSLGDITLELYPAAAPQTVASFLANVDNGKYEGAIIDNVFDGLAGGGIFRSGWESIDTKPHPQLPDESGRGLSNIRGTIAIATSHPGNPQPFRRFYLNLRDNLSLDDGRPTVSMVNGVRIGGIGMNVFGRVVEGLEVLDLIDSAPTGTQVLPDGFSLRNVPLDPIVVLGIERL